MSPLRYSMTVSVQRSIFIFITCVFGVYALYMFHTMSKSNLDLIPKSTNQLKNIPEYQKQLSFSKNRTNTVLVTSKGHNASNPKAIKRILWYIRPNYVPPTNKGELRPLTACPDLACRETSDRDLMSDADAIIFDGHRSLSLLQTLQRYPNQVWVFYVQEPPYHISSDLKSPSVKGAFNWTCTFRRDSDIWMPYGILEKRATTLHKDYEEIARRKNKMASWIVSNCKSQSKRKEFSELMMKNGISIDIFGGCGKKKCKRNISGHDQCRNTSTNEYSFYLAFENSLCKDYVTEKLFDYYNEDIILVVRGGKENYKQYPPGIFINTEDFKNVNELASYMKDLHNNKTKYVEFLKRKDAYRAIEETFTYKLTKRSWYTHYHYFSEPMCAMCRKLWDGESQPQMHKDIHSWVHKDACHGPSDLK